MSTVIYPSPIFGPVHSRRLGVSLGVNLMPADGKVCTFDCVYCECGFNKDFRPQQKRPTRQQVREALEQTLRRRHDAGEPLDVITFAGNGEPTSHPDFPGIIDDTVALRNKFFPEAKVSVLSNATLIHSSEIRMALRKVDNNIQKLDTVDPDYIRMIDRPVLPSYDIDRIVASLKMFRGHVIIQTMFMTGTLVESRPHDAHPALHIDVDNTDDMYVLPWLRALKEIEPQQVMIYTIDRETPDSGLRKASPEVLDEIKERVEMLGIPCTASY